MRLRLGELIACAVLLAGLCACGTPGAPQPPSLNLPRPVQDLTASRRGNKVDLEWTLPTKNTDRTNVKHEPVTRICRREGTTLMASCNMVAQVQPPTAKAPQKEKGQPPPGDVRIHYVDNLPPQLSAADPTGVVMYGVEELSPQARSAGMSNQVAVPLVPVIAPPDKVSAEVSGEGVRVSWSGVAPETAPTGVTYRYRIMRKPAGAPAYIALDDVEPLASGSYLDKTFAWEQKYEYRITTLSEVTADGRHVSVEGEDSPLAEVFTRDIYPPAQPAGLQAVFSSAGQRPFIDLTWAPNLEPDLAGYNVFRWTEGGQPQKLNAKPIVVPSYRDEAIVQGRMYFYAVSAVDLRDNESPRSEAASEKAP